MAEMAGKQGEGNQEAIKEFMVKISKLPVGNRNRALAH